MERENDGYDDDSLLLESRLAGMILDSMEYDLVAETAVVCASVQVGSIFVQEETKTFLSDQKKLAFCDDSGDPMTSLVVFWQYVKTPKKQLAQWCFENYVSLERMNSIYGFASRMCRIISNHGGTINTDLEKIDIPKARAHIPILFCRTFATNLAIYSGIPERGYFDFKTKKSVSIHPSSALKHKEITPEFIVYEHSVSTSLISVMNVCAADPAWLDGIDQTMLKEKKEDKLVPYTISFGPTVKSWIMAHMEDLCQEVGGECLEKTRASDPYNRLQIYVAVKNLPKLKTFVERIAEEKLNEICKRSKEVPIMRGDYVLRISGSGVPEEILMPDEFCSMLVGKAGINWTNDTKYRDRLEKYFSKFGQITEFVTFDEEMQKTSKYACLIRMENKEAAQRIFTYNCENCCDLDIKLKSSDSKDVMYALAVLSKHLGRFNPTLETKILEEDGSKKNANDLCQIKLLSLPLNVDCWRLKEVVGRLLDLYGIKCGSVSVSRLPAYPVEDQRTLEENVQQIAKYIIFVAETANITMKPLFDKNGLNCDPYPFDVTIRLPKSDTDIEFTAMVLFNDINLGMRVSDAIVKAERHGFFLEMGPLNYVHKATIRQRFHYHLVAQKFLFDVIRDDLMKIRNEIDYKDVLFSYNFELDYICHIHIYGGEFDAVNGMKTAIEKVISGFTFICRDGERIDDEEMPCHHLFTNGGRDYLHNVSKRCSVFLNISPIKMEVKIQGSVSNVELAKAEIKRFLLQGSDVEVIILRSPQYRQETLKALLAQNNNDLRSLEKRLGHGVRLDADNNRRELYFTGKESEYQQLLTMLRDVSDKIQLADVSVSKTDAKESETPECVVCLCAADPDNYCLEACGHYVCKSCIYLQLKTSAEMRGFPITCAGCEKPLTWCDLELFISEDEGHIEKDDPHRLQPLADASLACFIERHGDLYKYCSTPDCRGLHPVTEEAALHRCKLCSHVQCTRCGREEHESMKCEEYAKLKADAEESVRKWIREDEKKRRICPNPHCKAVIEKSGGCNHVECHRCKTHFCWICMFSAKESKEIYAHMDAKHGGSGADMHELLEEIGNNPFIREFLQREHPELAGANLNEGLMRVVLPDAADQGAGMVQNNGENNPNGFFLFPEGDNGLFEDDTDTDNVPEFVFEFGERS